MVIVLWLYLTLLKQLYCWPVQSAIL